MYPGYTPDPYKKLPTSAKGLRNLGRISDREGLRRLDLFRLAGFRPFPPPPLCVRGGGAGEGLKNPQVVHPVQP